MPHYELCYGTDGGVLNIDLHGHLDGQTIEEFLWQVERDPEEFELYATDGQALAVEHLWRWSVEITADESDDGEDGWRWVYSPRQGDGAVAVTRLDLQAWGWSRPNCAYHPDTPSRSGLPEYMWPEDGEHRATTIRDERMLYVCEECATRLYERERTQASLRMETLRRLQAAGLPTRLLWDVSSGGA